MNSTLRDTATLVGEFAQTFAGQYLTKHAVASPLGLWFLLSTLAPASTGAARAELEKVLGTTVDDAAARAAELSRTAHPALGAAIAVWVDRERLNDKYETWASGLTGDIEIGPVPTQRAANAWTYQHTRALIDTFPLSLSPDTVLVLASALATSIKWKQPFDDATAADLSGAFGQRALVALGASEGHERFLAHTSAAGIVGVHASASSDGLTVISVIGDVDCTPAQVHAAAGQVARLVSGRGPLGASKLGLFDVGVGTGHAWTVTESVELVMGGAEGSKVEYVDAVLPAWHAESELDLADAPGVSRAFDTLEEFLRPEGRPAAFDARQVAVASYRKDGFNAAAATGMTMRATAARPLSTLVRRATIRFNRPYAVLAVATNKGVSPTRSWRTVDLGCPAWDGVPVFSAWVTVPD